MGFQISYLLNVDQYVLEIARLPSAVTHLVVSYIPNPIFQHCRADTVRFDGTVYQRVYHEGKFMGSFLELYSTSRLSSCVSVFDRTIWYSGSPENVETAAANADDPRCPLLTNTKEMLYAFEDGIFDASTDTFRTYADFHPGLNLVTRAHFPGIQGGELARGSVEDLATPNFDKILRSQGLVPEEVYSAIGDLFYGQTNPNGCFVHLQGESLTGKTVFLQTLVEGLFRPRDVEYLKCSYPSKASVDPVLAVKVLNKFGLSVSDSCFDAECLRECSEIVGLFNFPTRYSGELDSLLQKKCSAEIPRMLFKLNLLKNVPKVKLLRGEAPEFAPDVKRPRIDA